jgi:hypothetical protein
MSSDRPDPAARLALFFVALGLMGRAVRYALDFPLWGDEASLALNLAGRDYAGLADELDHFQVAPVLFLWAEKAALTHLGDSELALRLLPFLAGVAALLLFWRLAGALLPPTPAALATGFLAVARWPVTMSANLKPYSLDLLVSLALLALAAAWLRDPRRRWLACLALLAPLAVGLSYPSVFVAGGASLALLPALWKRRVGSEWALFATFNVLLLTTFLASLLLLAQPRPGAPDLRAFMADYWRRGFPPPEWWRAPIWLASAHSGQMFAYPAGAERGGSVVTFALFALGAAWCWRHRPRWLLGLCLAPFALHLLAAALHRYPYGASARLAQHWRRPSACSPVPGWRGWSRTGRAPCPPPSACSSCAASAARSWTSPGRTATRWRAGRASSRRA